jgi:hypothetical protein
MDKLCVGGEEYRSLVGIFYDRVVFMYGYVMGCCIY